VVTHGAVSRGDPFALEGTVFDGRFRIEKRVAEGGFAVVYKAYQVALDRWVALKVLKAPRGHDEAARAAFQEKFAEEARTIARLQHPHIVEVYDFSAATLPSGEPAPWMALQWLDGETLATHLGRRHGAGEHGLAPREAVDFFRPVMQALAYAHRQGKGIVHRDVKPANIMVVDTFHGRSLKVLDFGIAKIMGDDKAPNTGQTRTENVPAFSPAYAAPEQVTFSRTGPWTDVHALGLILTELITDAPPFSDPDPEAHLFEQVMAPRRPTPASKGRDVGPFEPILAKALALSPRDRWKNAGELLNALERQIVGGGVDGRTILNAGASSSVALDKVAPARPRSRRAFGGWMVALAAVAGIGVVGLGIGRNRARRAPPPSRQEVELTAGGPVESRAPQASSRPTSVPPVAPVPAQEARAQTAGARSPSSVGTRRKRKPVNVKPPSRETDGRDLFDDTK
jgi:serine/threonine protein kinase